MEVEYCIECKTRTALRYDMDMCHDCYEDMFRGSIVKVSKNNPFEDVEEEDFELEHDIAELKEIEPTRVGFIGGIIKTSNILTIHMPKEYVLNTDKVETLEDVIDLLGAVCGQLRFYDNDPNFKNIEHLLKEVK